MRVASIDSLRVLAILAVICIHAHPLPKLFELVNLGASFAVPYFFIVSGYFFSKKLKSTLSIGELFISYTKRLTLILFVWILIYLLLPSPNTSFEKGILYGLYSSIHDNMVWIFEHPTTFLLRGGLPARGGHLWFIISLIMGLSILSLLAVYGQQNKIFLVAIPLYLFNLFAGAYAVVPMLGITVDFQSYEGPFVSTLFIAIGWWLAQSDYRPTQMLAFLTILCGLLCTAIELSVLSYFFNISLNQPYIVGTVLFGSGFMFLALAKPNLSQNTFFPYLGQFTLGIYVLHILVLNYFLYKIIYKLKIYLSDTLWQLIYPLSLSVGLFLFSLVITILLAKFPYTRRIVV